MFGLEIFHVAESQLDRGIGAVVNERIGYSQLHAGLKLSQHAVEVVLVDIDLAALGQRALLTAVTVIAHHHEFER
ncbi:hypothetical protein D3C81_1619020 [compost metagenome]